jgi:hypothetical protein
MCNDHCILVVLYPRVGHALYLDSTRSERIDYAKLRKILNDAANGYSMKLGDKVDNQQMIKANTHVSFAHKTDFC